MYQRGSLETGRVSEFSLSFDIARTSRRLPPRGEPPVQRRRCAGGRGRALHHSGCKNAPPLQYQGTGLSRGRGVGARWVGGRREGRVSGLTVDVREPSVCCTEGQAEYRGKIHCIQDRTTLRIAHLLYSRTVEYTGLRVLSSANSASGVRSQASARVPACATK